MKKRMARLAGWVLRTSCDWCGGSGQVTDPRGKKWPCIQCNPQY